MKIVSTSLDKYYARSPWDNARATLLLFWNLAAIACLLYFPLGWLTVRLGWFEYAIYDAFKLALLVFGLLSGTSVWMLSAMPYKAFYLYVLFQFSFALFWADLGELFSGKYVFEWYWYVPFVLFILSGLVGIYILRSWRKELNVSPYYQEP